MKSALKILAFALLTLFALECNPTPAPSPQDAAAPFVRDSATIDLSMLRPRPPRPTALPAASPDTRSAAQIAQAACTGVPDAAHPDGWRCAGKKPIAPLATGNTPITPVTWTVPSWFVNKTVGNDQNDCVTALTACKTKQEIWVHRLGASVGTCPRFQQATTIEQDANDTDNSDPLYLCAAAEKGGNLILKGGPVSATAAVFTRSAQKNTTVGSNSLLAGSFSAGAPAANVLVTNTTAGKSSKAWIRNSAGGANWNLSQPCAPQTVPSGLLTCTEVDTWATNDTVTLSSPIAINVISAKGTIADFDASFDNAVYLYNATLYDPAGVGTDDLHIGAQVQIVESTSQRFLNYNGFDFPGAGFITLMNVDQQVTVFTSAAGLFGTPVIEAGIVSGYKGEGQVSFTHDVILQGDPILGGGTGGQFAQGFNVLGDLFIATNLLVTQGTAQIQGATSVIYGSGSATINMYGSSHLAQVTGQTFVQAFTAPGLVTGIQINGSTVADTHSGANPDVITTGVTCTPTNMDAAGVPGCFMLGGASVSKK